MVKTTDEGGQRKRKCQLFSEVVSAIKEPPHENKTAAIPEATAFANYLGVTLSKLSPRKFCKAKNVSVTFFIRLRRVKMSAMQLLQPDQLRQHLQIDFILLRGIVPHQVQVMQVTSALVDITCSTH